MSREILLTVKIDGREIPISFSASEYFELQEFAGEQTVAEFVQAVAERVAAKYIEQRWN